MAGKGGKLSVALCEHIVGGDKDKARPSDCDTLSGPCSGL